MWAYMMFYDAILSPFLNLWVHLMGFCICKERFTSAGYLSLLAFTDILAKLPHMTGVMYAATGTSLLLTTGTWFFYRRIGFDFIVKIEFDVLKQCFIVTSPARSLLEFGTPKELLVDPANLKMLPKVK